MSEQLIEGQEAQIDKLTAELRGMADRLERNGAADFGGCFVVLPPVGGGDPITTLVLDSKQDPAQFWGLLKTKCDIALATLQEQQNTQRAWR